MAMMASGAALQQLNPGDEEFQQIVKLVNDTWEEDKVGQGQDARGLDHDYIKVTKIEKLKNKTLWKTYRKERRSLRERNCKELKDVETTKYLRHSNLGSQLKSRINEHYLFHGTKAENIDSITEEGLCPEEAEDKAMLGSGVYFTESPTKADQYTDSRKRRTGGPKTMILVRVILGNPWENKTKNPDKYPVPPAGYDSVVDAYKKRLFREFVIYNGSRCYPEFFITYKRDTDEDTDTDTDTDYNTD